MLRQSEVVIRAEIQHLAMIDRDMPSLRGVNHALGFEQTCIANALQLLGNVAQEAVNHGK